jgi:DNA repair exonuclease SbcCD ATPase subunit
LLFACHFVGSHSNHAYQALEDLEEAKLHAARELQAARADLKTAQEEFNSARQISLQKQSELQSELNQLKMSSELNQKDIERLHQALSSEKAQKDVKVLEMQQQLDNAMNELESAKASQRTLEMNCKIVDSERKNMGERLQARANGNHDVSRLTLTLTNRLPSTRRSATRALCRTSRRRPSLQRATFQASRTKWSSKRRSWTKHR